MINETNPARSSKSGQIEALASQQQQEQAGSIADANAAGTLSPKHFSATTGKQLTSKFRGVCWNKKNKRWQAVINSAGKYIYLGSFTSEDDAARHFDRAAIKIRGKRAKLNFDSTGYIDANGNLLKEPLLPPAVSCSSSKLTSNDGASTAAAAAIAPSKQAVSRHIAAGTRRVQQQQQQQQPGLDYQQHPTVAAAAAAITWQVGGPVVMQTMLQSMELNTGDVPPNVLTSRCWQQQQQQQNEIEQAEQQQQQSLMFAGQAGSCAILQAVTAHPTAVSETLVTQQVLGPEATPSNWRAVVPYGCTLDFSVPGQAGYFGLVFKCNSTRQQGCGVWIGDKLAVFGVHRDQEGALQTVITALGLLRHVASPQQQQQQQEQQKQIGLDRLLSLHPRNGSCPEAMHAVFDIRSNSVAAAAASAAATGSAAAAATSGSRAMQVGPNLAVGAASAAMDLAAAAATAAVHGDQAWPPAFPHQGSLSHSNSDNVSHNLGNSLNPSRDQMVVRGPLGSLSHALSARLASCELSEALALARQAAAEQGILDLAAALEQMSSSSGGSTAV